VSPEEEAAAAVVVIVVVKAATPWARMFLEKLTVAQPLIFPAL
jgi:hypothetical protein